MKAARKVDLKGVVALAVAALVVAGLVVAGLAVGGTGGAVSLVTTGAAATPDAGGTTAGPAPSETPGSSTSTTTQTSVAPSPSPSPSPSSSPTPDGKMVQVAESVDPCALLTDSEAAAGLGSTVTSVPTGTQCTYVANDGSGRSIALLVPALTLPKGASLKAGAEQAATALGGEVRTLTGVGDEGYALIAPTLAQAIGRSGDRLLSAVLTAPAGSATEQATLLGNVLRTAFSRY